jgi:molybdopterin/thiamine biosynthesis adenylyltransferase
VHVVEGHDAARLPAGAAQHFFHGFSGGRVGGGDDHRARRRSRSEELGHVAARPGVDGAAIGTGLQLQIVVEGDDQRVRKVYVEEADRLAGVVEEVDVEGVEAVGETGAHDALPVLVIFEDDDLHAHECAPPSPPAVSAARETPSC